MKTNKELLKTNAEQYAKARNVDPSRIDFESILDKELTEAENWKKIREKVEGLMDAEDRIEQKAEDLTEEEIEAKEREIHEKYIEEIEQQKEEELEKFFGDGSTDAEQEVQSFYNFFNHYVRAIAKGHHDALMINAKHGIGKSYQIQKTLTNELGADGYKTQSGYCPPFQFYKKLYEVQSDLEKEVLFLDDIEGLINNKKALAILKQATWSETDSRYVEWNSSSSKLQNDNGENIPEKFEFTGRIIMCFNDIPDDPIVHSLQDRCFYHELQFTYEQRLKLIRAVAEKGVPDHDIPEDARIEIANWIKDVTNSATKDVNLRTLMRAFKLYDYARDIGAEVGDDYWEELTAELIEKDENLYHARDIILDGQFDTVSDMKSEFKDRTGKSGRTFNRAKKELLEKSEKVQEVLGQ